jgi:hypothetical protein
MSPP